MDAKEISFKVEPDKMVDLIIKKDGSSNVKRVLIEGETVIDYKGEVAQKFIKMIFESVSTNQDY